MKADGDRKLAAAALRTHRTTIVSRLAAIVAAWPKYANSFATDPHSFAEREFGASIDYLACYFETGEETWRHLYVGEKIKQFYDSKLSPEESRRLTAATLAAEREAISGIVEGGDRALLVEALQGVERILLPADAKTMRVLFVGDCLYLDVVGFLGPLCLEDGIEVRPAFVASKDPAEQRRMLVELSREKFDLVFYSPLTYEFSPEWERLLKARNAALPAARIRDAAEAALAPGLPTLETLAELFECNIFVHNASALRRHEGRPRDRAKLLLTRRLSRMAGAHASRRIAAEVERLSAGTLRHVHLLDEGPVLGSVGAFEAGRLLHNAGLQHPAAFGRALAPHYADIITVHAHLIGKKVVVCDLDNTLWKGVVGERLGIRHHADRQEILKKLKAKGVVLAINSKNDPRSIVWEGGVLGETDFVSSQINWEPKVANMRRIAAELNLKEKDFVFVDDRADERALAGEAFAGLYPLDALSPRTWRLLALWSEWLNAGDDADRTAFYKQRAEREKFIQREQQSSAAEQASLFATLRLKVAIRQAGEKDAARAVELINRTNQFNMTGARVSARELRAWLEDPDVRLVVTDASDRFGTMGTVSALVARDAEARVEITHFVLSCRVFGYGIETAILNAVRSLAGKPIYGPFVGTPFNDPCRDVYPRSGFLPAEGGWELPPGIPPAPSPEWLTVSADLMPFVVPTQRIASSR